MAQIVCSESDKNSELNNDANMSVETGISNQAVGDAEMTCVDLDEYEKLLILKVPDSPESPKSGDRKEIHSIGDIFKNPMLELPPTDIIRQQVTLSQTSDEKIAEKKEPQKREGKIFYDGDAIFEKGNYDYVIELKNSSTSKKIPINSSDDLASIVEIYWIREGWPVSDTGSKGLKKRLADEIKLIDRERVGKLNDDEIPEPHKIDPPPKSPKFGPSSEPPTGLSNGSLSNSIFEKNGGNHMSDYKLDALKINDNEIPDLEFINGKGHDSHSIFRWHPTEKKDLKPIKLIQQPECLTRYAYRRSDRNKDKPNINYNENKQHKLSYVNAPDKNEPKKPDPVLPKSDFNVSHGRPELGKFEMRHLDMSAQIEANILYDSINWHKGVPKHKALPSLLNELLQVPPKHYNNISAFMYCISIKDLSQECVDDDNYWILFQKYSHYDVDQFWCRIMRNCQKSICRELSDSDSNGELDPLVIENLEITLQIMWCYHDSSQTDFKKYFKREANFKVIIDDAMAQIMNKKDNSLLSNGISSIFEYLEKPLTEEQKFIAELKGAEHNPYIIDDDEAKL